MDEAQQRALQQGALQHGALQQRALQQSALVKHAAKRTVWLETRAGTVVGSADECAAVERVAVKRFHAPGRFGRFLDRRRAADERRKLERLYQLGIPVPGVAGIEEHAAGVDLVTRWIDGAQPLSELLRDRGPWPVAQAIVARQLGRLLALARIHGVTHSDLHAGNVLIDGSGRAWLVDVRAVRVHDRALTAREHARLCIAATADVRERMPARLRLRVWAACAKHLRSAGLEPAPHADVRAWNESARHWRRRVVAHARLRWTRESSVTAAMSRGDERGLRARALEEAAAWSALDDPHATSISADLATVREAWWTAGRLLEHAIAGPTPLALRTHPDARAVFDAHGASLALDDLARGSDGHRAARRRRAASSLGALLGSLCDRGLALAGRVESAVAFDAHGRASVRVGARIEAEGGAHARHSPGQRAALALHRCAPMARDASRRELALFLAAFLAAQELPRSERAVLRERLHEEPAPRAEKLRRRMRARLLNGATRVAGLAPHAIVHGALAGLSPLASFTRAERTTRANLELVLGASTTAADRREIARGVRRHAARQFAEWLRLARGTRPDAPLDSRGRWLDEVVELDPSVAILERELARGRGALVVTAHIGNWELLAARLRRAGQRGAVVGYRRPNDSSARWFEDLRTAYGVATIPQSSHPRTILRALDEGLVVGLLADLEVRRLDGVFLPFLGREALTMTAPSALARAARVPLLPARCVLEPATGRYRLSFESPLELDRSLDGRARTIDLTRRLNAVFERWIRATPEQWAWHQPRWRTQPGELDPLPRAARRTARAGASSSRHPPPRARAAPSLQSADQGLAGD